jgi:hypothetical protein
MRVTFKGRCESTFERRIIAGSVVANGDSKQRTIVPRFSREAPHSLATH